MACTSRPWNILLFKECRRQCMLFFSDDRAWEVSVEVVNHGTIVYLVLNLKESPVIGDEGLWAFQWSREIFRGIVRAPNN